MLKHTSEEKREIRRYLDNHPEISIDEFAAKLDIHPAHIKQAYKGGFVYVKGSTGEIKWSKN